ncbi:MAG: sporulation protein YabP [Oscillospiraceae bacterium]|nr:sporulation protein YabP [Oscillospiraceae bacterium]
MNGEKRAAKQPHNIILEGRKSMTVSGVVDIDCFDEQEVTALTDLGNLVIKGTEIHINSLSLETGDLALSGHINSIVYTNAGKKEGGFLKRIFK